MTEDNVLALRMRLTELEGEKQSSGNVVAEQLAHLREKLQQEERARENMEVNLKQQLEAARNEIGEVFSSVTLHSFCMYVNLWAPQFVGEVGIVASFVLSLC